MLLNVPPAPPRRMLRPGSAPGKRAQPTTPYTSVGTGLIPLPLLSSAASPPKSGKWLKIEKNAMQNG